MPGSVSKLFDGAVSRLFVRARPVVSDNVVKTVVNFLSEKLPGPHGVALDVGCGTGFSTVKFANHFQRTVGIDVSPTQVAEAHKQYSQQAGLSFEVGNATQLPSTSASVDLVLCIQTAHWLDMDKFFAECHRVLKPHGVIALIGYSLLKLEYKERPESNESLNMTVKKLYDMLVNGGFWHEKRYILDRQFVDITLPYKEQLILRDDPNLFLYREMTVDHLVDYFASWSGVRQYQKDVEEVPGKADGQPLLMDRFKQELLQSIGTENPSTLLTAVYPWFLCLCRKPL